ncbi:hypothetical protein BHE74_00034550 [Ensete ventricosum]|nr:hypothetical protein BHE74_00034550 [Ensete ventricosum]
MKHQKHHKRRGCSRAYRGESVAGVRNEHAGLADGAVAHRDALDKPGGTHLLRRPVPPSKSRLPSSSRSLDER